MSCESLDLTKVNLEDLEKLRESHLKQLSLVCFIATLSPNFGSPFYFDPGVLHQSERVAFINQAMARKTQSK